MTGLLAGLLAVAALPPAGFATAGGLWLVPWLMGMRQPQRARLINTLIALGLPLGVALGPVAGREPALAMLVILAVLGVFGLAAWLAADRHGGTGSRRLAGTMIGLVGLLAGLRSMGIPASLSLFVPPSVVPFGLVDGAGVIAADGAIGLWQTGLAVALMAATRPFRHRDWIAPLGIALSVVPLSLIASNPLPKALPDSPRLAVVQTLDRRAATSTLLAHAALADVEARWVVWPEAASPVLLPPPWQRPPGGMIHLRHGYRYQAPGRLRSEVPIRPGKEASSDARGGWTKIFPLPYAESALSAGAKPGENGLAALEVLICSDAAHPRAVDRAAVHDPRLIVNPARLPAWQSGMLPGLHRRSVHLQAARAGIPVLVVAHGGPSVLLHPDGRQRRLAPAGVQAVVTLPLPVRPAASEAAPGLITAGLGGGWLALITLGRRRVQPATGHSAASAIVIALATGALIVGLNAPSPRPESTPPDPAFDRALERDAPHRVAIARLSEAYGLAYGANAVPAGRDEALVWLCEQTGLMAMDGPVSAMQPPAYGLQRTAQGLRAIRWLPGEPPLAFPGSDAGDARVAVDAPGIHWLATVRRPQRCRSAAQRLPPTGGTSRHD